MSLDLIDKKMLFELDRDGRIPISQLAKILRINQNTAQYRLKRLEETKYIKGYYAIIDNSKLGYFGFRIYLRLTNSDNEIEDKICVYLVNLNELNVLAKLEGNYDLAIMCYVKSIYDFYEFWNKFKEKFKEYIGRTQIAVFTKVLHFDRGYLLDNQKKESVPRQLVVGGSTEIKHDALDLKLLKIISGNARISILEISKKINVSVKTLMYRLKNLEKKGIIAGYKPLINLEKINYRYSKINFLLRDMSKMNELLEFARYNKFITYVDLTISQNDFEIDIETNSRKEVDDILKQIKNIVDVSDYEEIGFKEYVKLVYF